MIYTDSITRSFAASHEVDGDPIHGKMHGHSYRVEIAIRANPIYNINDWLKDSASFHKRVDDAVAELANRHLNDMLQGQHPTPMGIVMWFWERLSLHVSLYEVTVWQDDLKASARYT